MLAAQKITIIVSFCEDSSVLIATRTGDAATVLIQGIEASLTRATVLWRQGRGGEEEPNSAIEALVSDHLENSKNWLRLELVANKNELSSATAEGGKRVSETH